MILGILHVEDLVLGTGLRTDSFLLVAMGKEPEAGETEESLKGE